ncbi:Bug family tripartite tricarboxylate transporter substrate binding protein [Hylemonella sp. W303a]|uniref:Bug family tripartite tricarboxylate transporter substrate binding protein n=1 Tax=Hylemonella sp. W303a TaxID=3389873 RepID=UPI00396B4698
MHTRIRKLLSLVMELLMGLLMGLLIASTGAAQEKFPDGPVKIIVPFAAGGGVDNAARLLAKQLQTDLGVPVIVDNRPGASGAIGGKAVQTAPADGLTLLFSAATQVLTKEAMAKPPYDPLTDFSFIARTATAPLLMVISPNLPQTHIKEVMQAARNEPDKWYAGLPALGAPSHLATLMLAKEGQLNLATVVYRGTAPALTDVAGGTTQILVDSIISLQSLAKAGKVKAIAVTSAQRSALMPEVPTAAESGFPNFVAVSWYGVWGPKGLPAQRQHMLNKAINEATRQLVKSGAYAPLGIDPVIETIDDFKKYSQRYVAESAALLKSSGYKPE